jgi:hypothetical protein
MIARPARKAREQHILFEAAHGSRRPFVVIVEVELM